MSNGDCPGAPSTSNRRPEAVRAGTSSLLGREDWFPLALIVVMESPSGEAQQRASRNPLVLTMA